MLSKLRLLRSDKYAYYVCAKIMAEMVTDCIEGRPNAVALGCEGGDIPEWDDVVLDEQDGSRLYVQIKRQTTDFSNHSPHTREKSGRGGKNPAPKSEPHPLSPFDEAISALVRSAEMWNSRARASRFEIYVPDLNVEIKNGIPVRALLQFCDDCRNPTVTPQGLSDRASNDTHTGLIFAWLTVWCGFKDWAQIHTVLRSLTVKTVSLEADLQRQTTALLERHFFPGADAADRIRHFLEDNASDAGATTPLLTLRLLSPLIRDASSLWTLYSTDKTHQNWSISGINSYDPLNIEPPTLTVATYWNVELKGRRLQISAKYAAHSLSQNSLTPQLLRLASHAPRPTVVELEETGTWVAVWRQALGDTLGVTDEDLTSLNLPWVDKKGADPIAQARKLSCSTDIDDECAKLAKAMNAHVWATVQQYVGVAISGMTKGDLKVACDKLWNNVRKYLDSQESRRDELFAEMLSPVSEGLAEFRVCRVGPRTASLLSNGLHHLLIVAIGLRKENCDPEELLLRTQLHAIAVQYWSGPYRKNVRKLVQGDSDADLLDLLGKEPSQILVLPYVESSPTELAQQSFAADDDLAINFAAPRQPIAITGMRRLSQAIKTGRIHDVRTVLEPAYNQLLARNTSIAST